MKDAKELVGTLCLKSNTLNKQNEKKEEEIKKIQQEATSLNLQLNDSAKDGVAQLDESRKEANRLGLDLKSDNPMCLDDDDNEVEGAPKNMDAIRVPRKRTKPLNEAKLADLGGSQTVFDLHTNPAGKRQSYSQSLHDTSSWHSQPDSLGKKGKRLHMEEEDDNEDEQSYSNLPRLS